MAVGGEAETGQEALQLVRQGDWSLVLLDISLKDMNGLDLLAGIHRIDPELPVLVLTAHTEDSHAMAAMRGGALGYITKDSPMSELQLAIRRVAAGQTYLGPRLAQLLVNGISPHHHDNLARHETLSKREFEVMVRLGRGMPVTQIAERLSLNPKTVSTYRARVLDKLALQSNADIVRYVDRHRLDPGRPD